MQVTLVAEIYKGTEEVDEAPEAGGLERYAPRVTAHGPAREIGIRPAQQFHGEIHANDFQTALAHGARVTPEPAAKIKDRTPQPVRNQMIHLFLGRALIAVRVQLPIVRTEGRDVPGLAGGWGGGHGDGGRREGSARARYADAPSRLGGSKPRNACETGGGNGRNPRPVAASKRVPSPVSTYQPPLFERRDKEEYEGTHLAPHAAHAAHSRGRAHAEEEDPLRTCYERDRDRITHSTAFRRLGYKTQVFVNSEGDQYRTRLSHSLEVCQVARSLGSALRLNGPLCEALALAHDIGHPPFGHRGETALDDLLAEHGGFRHNAQVLRVVDLLERRSPDYAGLNLTREMRESLLKHEATRDWPEELEPRPASPLLEAQLVDMADSTAYAKHDLEDGLLAGMFSEEQVTDEVDRKSVV